MKTLYDFLGALPDDDAEGLRAAFRRAVKDAHPDLNPADPEAALKFRELVRANDILSDEQLRAVYDRLLRLARIEHETPKRAAVFDRVVIGVACGVIALASILVVSVAGFRLLLAIDGPAFSSAQIAQILRHEPAQAGPNELSDAFSWTGHINPAVVVGVPNKFDEKLEDLSQRFAASAQDPVGGEASPTVPLVRDFATNDAKHYRERGILAYRSGDLYLALAAFSLAIQFDPGFSEAYIDRAIVFHRIGDQARAFSDITQARRVDTELKVR